MASFAPIRGTKAQITSTPMVDGQFLVETDQGDQNKTYIDSYDSNNQLQRTMCGGGGHPMVGISDDPQHLEDDIDEVASVSYSDAQNTKKVANIYTIQRYSNADVITLLATVPKGTNTVGLWEDENTWKNYNPSTDDPTVYRAGWLWSESLYNILADNMVEIELVFDVGKSETVNIYAYRVDDNVPLDIPDGQGGTTKVNGGAVAIKLNGSIRATGGLKLGVNLKRQRTQLEDFTVIS